MNYLWQLIKRSFKVQFTYRTALIAGLLTNLFFGFLRAALLLALYQGQTEVNGMSIEAAVTYTAFTQGLIAFLSIFSYFDVIRSVYSGDVAGDLIRPASLFKIWMGRDFGKSVVNLLIRGVLLMAIFSFFFKLIYPDHFSQWIYVVISLLLGWGISFCWRFLVNLASFWSPDAMGIARIAYTVSQLACGFILPLRLLPDWFSAICAWTPFPSMVNSPTEIYLGILNGPDMWWAISQQVLWLAGMYLLTRVVLSAGVKKLVIQGG